MISVESLTKSYGVRTLFEEISFKVNSRERVGLVARNGHGKTTLFQMITGQITADSGQINTPKNYRIGYVAQKLVFTEDTLLAEAVTSLPDNEADQHWKAERILAGLGFSQKDLARPPAEFSGGFQVRLNLAKALIAEPDLLLLDEPTNYLDIETIRWIERFLLSWPHELMLITHDRSFMDRLATHILGIHRGKVKKIEGGTDKYYSQIAQEEEIHEKTRRNSEKRQKEIELFIGRFRAKARLAGLVQSRIKTLAKMEKGNKLEKVKSLEFTILELPHRGRHICTAEGLTFGYEPEQPLFEQLSFSVNAGERICICGPNGKGKSTLLRILAGGLAAQKGQLRYNPNIETGYFEQTHLTSLNESRTVEDEILMAHPDMDRRRARSICGMMLFSGDLALKKIEILSGGEKSRVMLGKILATPVNLLLLDEPTNHLDMDACDALLAALDNFDGTVIMVTHNEFFLHALAQRLIVFQNDTVSMFEGSYADFLERGGWQDEATVKPLENGTNRQAGISKKVLRKKRSAILNQRTRALKPMEKKMAQLEASISQDEEALATNQQAMVEAANSGDGERIATLAKEINMLESRIETAFDQLVGVTTEHDLEKAPFDDQLAELEGEF